MIPANAKIECTNTLDSELKNMSNTRLSILTSYSIPSIGNIESYVQAVNAFPVLSQEEEIALASRFQNEGDLKAAETLVLSNLRYVARIAKGYNGYGLAFADLMQEGSIGLMKAVKRFDPAVGVRLVSFAVHWIKSEIHDFVIRNWRIVKVATTKAQRKLFFNLRRYKQNQRLGWLTQEEQDAVAKDLGVPVNEVCEMESRMNAHHDIAFDMTEEEANNDDHFVVAPAQYLAAPDLSPLEALETSSHIENAHENLTIALESLDTRSQDIVSHRWLRDEKMTLKALADKYKVSIERVRQIENVAMQKLKEYFLN